MLSHRDLHRVICTDFGATLYLSDIEKDNCSVDNHAVVYVLCIYYDWRQVQFMRKREDREMHREEVIVNEYDKWIMFGDTISREKKKDHVFHNACLTHLIRHYVKICTSSVK